MVAPRESERGSLLAGERPHPDQAGPVQRLCRRRPFQRHGRLLRPRRDGGGGRRRLRHQRPPTSHRLRETVLLPNLPDDDFYRILLLAQVAPVNDAPRPKEDGASSPLVLPMVPFDVTAAGNEGFETWELAGT